MILEYENISSVYGEYSVTDWMCEKLFAAEFRVDSSSDRIGEVNSVGYNKHFYPRIHESGCNKESYLPNPSGRIWHKVSF